ncbi:MAG: hypothetical protein US60_C0004G0008 [Microgenomates group bacterium GW2011_GWC1_37_8]|uniref:UDP-N-acetylglucosamine--N-acetylmuramyl-(pentapeptide) pyrophosphoryl-undecaprenol N-acetylglucosamine transferase n=1 Tax=Candidatus Woesebacteria bacterium GW2011_GWB1_38_8 TaxID=1618570 RepID=A0A0G0P8U3_9BACT|nr:MAG: hypothetical protein US60_C0004G0008 [Microgenomates group bacterium GW2011_GWC1_37_8]KKQ85726.1 MAG: hypothetical protein UT08_C0004G0038 [Candidatus Woesebacteria bacterium GW2011_GWB1_38_8]
MRKKSSKKIVLTGGHASSTAFVVIEEIRRQKKDWDIYWIGFKSSVEGKRVPTLSSLYFPKFGIKVYGIITGRIQRKLTIWTIPSLFKIPIGFIHALLLLIQIRPDLILSFGGFSAYPVVVVGFLLRIPVIIHEQTTVAGRANMYSSFFAKKIAISRESSRAFFPKEKVIFTGSPIPQDLLISNTQVLTEKYPTIFITGGQSGSIAINAAVGDVLDEILKNYRVIHLTGIQEEKKFIVRRARLKKDEKERYRVYGIVDLKKFNELFNRSWLVVTRAGANTVSKIIASNKPTIFIPLPISYLDEQFKNALYAKKYVISEIIDQKQLTGKILYAKIVKIRGYFRDKTLKIKYKKSPDVNASKKLVGLIEKFI